MYHIFVNNNQLFDNQFYISKIDDLYNFNHLKNALRIKLNEDIIVSIIPYNEKYDYLTSVFSISDDNIILIIKNKIENNELNFNINIYQGLPKNDKLEMIIEKTVELGVHSITPVNMEYCISKWDIKKQNNKYNRLNSISKSASEQSKRSYIPIVNNVIDYDQMINSIKNDEYNILFYEVKKNINDLKYYINSIKQNINKNDNINIIIGPEGGFSELEINKASDNNINIFSLGKRILRTETAAITSMSIIMYEMEN